MSQPQAEPDPERTGFLTRLARGATERVMDAVPPDSVLEHVDVNAVLDRVDMNAVLDRIDVNVLLDRIDVNTLLDRVDVNALLDRADVDALLARADIDALMTKVDIEAIVERAKIPEIVAESTSRLTGSALDLFRKPVVGLDEIVFRGFNRLFGRDPSTFPTGPGHLTDWVAGRIRATAHHERDDTSGVVTGRYSGPVTRLLAFLIDVFVVSTGFTLTVNGLRSLAGLLLPDRLVIPDVQGLWSVIGLVVWIFLYLWLATAIFGKTVGKTVMGTRVVGSDGGALRGRQALVRAVTYPLSFVVVGIGLLGVVFGRERRAWHDHFAGTAVVYDWGSRQARMPIPLAAWLDRRNDPAQDGVAEAMPRSSPASS